MYCKNHKSIIPKNYIVLIIFMIFYGSITLAQNDQATDHYTDKNTLYIGAGIGTYLSSAGNIQTLLSSNIDFRLTHILHLNSGIDYLKGGGALNSGIIISLIPEITANLSRLSVSTGIGGYAGSLPGYDDISFSGGIIGILKLNYIVSKKLGIGIEIKHPENFREPHFLLLSSIGVRFIL